MTGEEYNKQNKLQYFEYIIFKLKEWYEEKGRLDFCVNMTRVKAHKLLFFCASIKNPYGEDLLDVFDSFYAMSNGFVESDVHLAMVDDSFVNIRFKDRRFSFKTSYFKSNLSNYEKEKIDIAVGCLKAVSPKLVWYNAMDLMEMHRLLICWKSCNMTAEALGKNSTKVPLDLIRKDKFIFRITNFEIGL